MASYSVVDISYLKRPWMRQVLRGGVHSGNESVLGSHRSAMLPLHQIVRAFLYLNKPIHAQVSYAAEAMESRRRTVFPRTGDALHQVTNTIRNEDSFGQIRNTKRKFNGDGIVDLELTRGLVPAGNRQLPRASAPASNPRKVFTPVDDDPERFYQCMYLVDPEGKRPYCLAQEKTLTTKECHYRIVMIRRSAARDVVGTSRPHPNLLNILSVFRFNNSFFTVLDRPGFPLSEIAVCHSPQLGLAQIQTISKEVRPEFSLV